MQPWSTSADLKNTDAETPLIPAQAGTTTAAADLRTESYATFNKVVQDQEWQVTADGRAASAQPQNEKVFTKRVIMLTIALGIFTYHSMTYDHLLPIFFQDERMGDSYSAKLVSSMAGGLGLSIKDVGVISSVNGIIALLVQAVVFPVAAAWLGVWRLFMVTTVLHPIAYFIVPYLVVLPEEYLYAGIYTCLTIRNLFAILVYPVILILLKEASPSSSCLGKINGLAASTGAACRTIASPIAGLLYGIGIDERDCHRGCYSINYDRVALVMPPSACFGRSRIPAVIRTPRTTNHAHHTLGYTHIVDFNGNLLSD